MSYSTNFAGLKADLIQNADDYSAEYMAQLEVIIAEAETKVLRDLDLEIFQDEVAAGTLTIGTRTFTRPTGLLKINALWLVVSGARTFIQKRTKGYCEAFGEVSTAARPTYYAEQSEDSLYFVGTPDAAYAVIAYGIVRPAGLSDDNPTTWLSTNAGDLLFMACKLRSEQYLVNKSAADTWKNEYQNDLLPKAKIELRGMSRASYELARAVGEAKQVI